MAIAVVALGEEAEVVSMKVAIAATITVPLLTMVEITEKDHQYQMM